MSKACTATCTASATRCLQSARVHDTYPAVLVNLRNRKLQCQVTRCYLTARRASGDGAADFKQQAWALRLRCRGSTCPAREKQTMNAVHSSQCKLCGARSSLLGSRHPRPKRSQNYRINARREVCHPAQEGTAKLTFNQDAASQASNSYHAVLSQVYLEEACCKACLCCCCQLVQVLHRRQALHSWVLMTLLRQQHQT